LPSKIQLAVVVGKFNSEITDKMLDQALTHASNLGASVRYVCKVPGAYDMPLIIQTLLEKDDVDAVVTLGAIIKGETKHDEVIAYTLSSKMADLSLRYRKPVTLGVAGPGVTWELAEARIVDYAERSVSAAIDSVLLQRRLKEETNVSNHPLVVE